jgi:hypothetical protein
VESSDLKPRATFPLNLKLSANGPLLLLLPSLSLQNLTFACVSLSRKRVIPTDSEDGGALSTTQPRKKLAPSSTRKPTKAGVRHHDGSESENNTTSMPPPSASTHKGKGKPLRLRPGTPSHARRSTAVAAADAASSAAANFVYRARPSSSIYAMNPNLPPTPSVGTSDQNSNVRMPRRHESIQAYSLNGSPLGVIDLEVDADADIDDNGDEDDDLGNVDHEGGDASSPLHHRQSRDSYFGSNATLQQQQPPGSPPPKPPAFVPQSTEFTFNLDSLRKELDRTQIPYHERERLEKRLVQLFGKTSTAAT